MPIRWRVEYATEGGLPLVFIADHDRRWRDLPATGVVRVHLEHGPYTHALGGMDNYWLCPCGLVYGAFNDPANRDWYDGMQAVAWAWPTPDTHARISNPSPPPGAHVIAGVMLADTLARDLGLLGPHDSTPPRPVT